MLEFSNYYFSPIEEKIQELKLVNLKKDFLYYSPKYIWINPIYHIRGKIIQYVIYGILIGKDLVKYLLGGFQIKPQKGSVIVYWLIGLCIFRLLTISYFLNSYFFDYSPRRHFNGLEFILISDTVYLVLFLFFNPKFFDSSTWVNGQGKMLLESMDKNRNKQKDKSVPEKEVDAIPNHIEIFSQLNEFLKSSKYYLDKDCTVEQLSNKLNIPQRVLSNVVRSETSLSLKDFINRYRIEFIIKEYESDPYFREQSMTLIAEIAGFGTRQSLYIACSKLYGCQPKALFEKAIIAPNSDK